MTLDVTIILHQNWHATTLAKQKKVCDRFKNKQLLVYQDGLSPRFEVKGARLALIVFNCIS
jgi:hypothetical protein